MEPIRLSRAQVREIDRRSIEDCHIPGIVLMENAALAAADLAMKMLQPLGHSALILCGGGNNGGDGLAIARHLHNRGIAVSLALTIDPAAYRGDALINWQIVSAMRLPCHPASPDDIRTTSAAILIDAIFGTGLTHPPRPPFPALVSAIKDSAKPLLSIDVPSGLDCDTGHPLGPTIRATQTITFVAEKLGFANPAARPYLGDVTVGSIGCPRELIAKVAAEHSDPSRPVS